MDIFNSKDSAIKEENPWFKMIIALKQQLILHKLFDKHKNLIQTDSDVRK